MNKKTIKKINRQVPIVLVDWLRSLVDKEEHSKITVDTYKKYLPELQYISVGGTYVLGQFSERWTNRMIKKMVKDGHVLENINFEYFNRHYKDYTYVGKTYS